MKKDKTDKGIVKLHRRVNEKMDKRNLRRQRVNKYTWRSYTAILLWVRRPQLLLSAELTLIYEAGARNE